MEIGEEIIVWGPPKVVKNRTRMFFFDGLWSWVEKLVSLDRSTDRLVGLNEGLGVRMVHGNGRWSCKEGGQRWNTGEFVVGGDLVIEITWKG